MTAFGLCFLVAFSLCWALVLTQRWHGRYTSDRLHGVQKFHQGQTPRVGGVAIFIALAVGVGWAELMPSLHPNTLPASTLNPRIVLLAALPAFLAGLADDLSLSESAFWRLVATLGSGVLAWWWGGVQLQRTGVPALDAALALAPMGLAFTAFALAGLANALNIIDGFNGQAGGYAVLALLALAAMAVQAGDAAVAPVCMALAAAVAGFVVVNFPQGRLFLGDGGAYLLGFLLGCAAIALVQRNAAVSPFSVLAVLAYPVWEVAFSLWRRRHRGQALMQPDALHLHMLLQRRITRRRWPAATHGVWHNAAVAPFTWALAALGAAGGVWAWASTGRALLVLAVFVLAYCALYRRLVRGRWG